MTTQPDEDVIRANIAVHSAMASTYEEREPHFRPENRARVRAILARLAGEVGGGRLLDLGCGTGFMIRLAVGLFREIHGVDVTPAMLARVDTRGADIRLHEGRCESLPFEDGYFDCATAYSFLDHASDWREILREAHRVLRPGGKLYADLLPNRDFFALLATVRPDDPALAGSPHVRREATMLATQHQQVEREYGIDASDFLRAEPWKTGTRGIDAREIGQVAAELGFPRAEIEPHWFLGQGSVFHEQGEAAAALVAGHLRTLLPMSAGLFKYLRIVLTR
jgi:ubiquinone/menaquinone biosynthesis C-methylase UbiE